MPTRGIINISREKCYSELGIEPWTLALYTSMQSTIPSRFKSQNSFCLEILMMLLIGIICTKDISFASDL